MVNRAILSTWIYVQLKEKLASTADYTFILRVIAKKYSG